MNAVDPTGNVPVFVVTAAAGGVIGGVAGGAVAWISGENAEGILRGVATGALSGVVAGLFPQSLIGAVAGGALASAAVQTYELSLGWRCSYSGVELALSAGIGGAAHGAGVAAAQMAPRVAGFFRGGACFAAGTPIATREGSKPIEEIRAGDTVRTADPATGQQSYGKVVRTFVGEVEKILEVETADGARVKATEGHPFFVEGRGFIAARKLARGDLLRRVDGRRVAVVGLGWEEARTRVYNFEVEGTHTYYAAGVWVHNAQPCFDPREQAIADYLSDLGRNVQPNPLQGVAGAGRQGDALLDGVLTEFKTPGFGAGSNTIRNEVRRSVKGTGQARSIVIDGRGAGLTEDEALLGIARALGVSHYATKLDYLAIIGDDFFVGRAPR